MKFKKLTEADKEYIASVYKNKDLTWDDRMTDLCTKFSVSERQLRRWCSEKLGLKERVEGIGVAESDQYKTAQSKQHDPNKKYFLITWAQNNTEVHKGLFNNILAYKEFLGKEKCEVIVIAGRYNNFNKIHNESEVENKENWDTILLPYLSAARHNLSKNVKILGDVKITPTVKYPLVGLESFTNSESVIVGSPKQALQTMHVLDPVNKPKILISTGACTQKNYSDSAIGKKSEFLHEFGFVICELDSDERFYLRYCNAKSDTGEFTDLYFNVKNSVVTRTNKIDAIVLGDIHSLEVNKTLIDRTKNELLSKLKTSHMILHDVFSGVSINHHESKNPFLLAEKEFNGTNSLQAEIDDMLNFLETFNNKEYDVTIVKSNHDYFLDLFLIDQNWKTNLKNSIPYMNLSLALLEGKAKNGVVAYLINEHFPKFKCLNRNDSFTISGYELSQHGDKIGGQRGNPVSFAKLNTKIICGHSHSPMKLLSYQSVGTSTKLRLSYNESFSNWLGSHIIISSETKKSQHILFIGEDCKFTTFE